MNIFLICPVRDATYEESMNILAYVRGLEHLGHNVHWPERDTVQDQDPIGTEICAANRRAIMKADQVHVWWSPTSAGSKFDFGMAFVLGKEFVLGNPLEVKATPTKSFENVILKLTGHELGE